MIKSLSIILLVCGLSAHYGDLERNSALYSILLPAATALSLIALALWLVAFLYRRGIGQKAHRRAGDIDLLNAGIGGSDGG